MKYDHSYFANKSCAVTGAASGVGLALAEELLESGAAQVTLADYNAAALAKAAARLTAGYPGRVQSVLCNVTEEPQVTAMVQRAADFGGGRLDLLINCAGAALVGLFSEILPTKSDNPYIQSVSTVEDWENGFALNFYGPLYGCRAALPLMARQGGGQIINIISGIAFSPMAFQSRYAATKAALLALSLSLRAEYAHYGIRVSAATPGTTATAIFKGAAPPPEAQPPHASAQRILNGAVCNARVIFGDDSDLAGAYSCFFPDLPGKTLDAVYRRYMAMRLHGSTSFDTGDIQMSDEPLIAAIAQNAPDLREQAEAYAAHRDTETLDRSYYCGKTAIVTGAAGGVGLALCTLLLACGAAGVVLVDLDKPSLALRVAELGARFPGRVHGIPCNVADEKSVQAMIAEASACLNGRIDLLINCAGIGQMGQFAAMPDSDAIGGELHIPVDGLARWDAIFGINFYGPLYVCRAVLPLMAAQGGGQIVNIISGTAFIPMPYQSAYSASKAALNMLTLVLRYEYWDTGIKFNSATPGTTATPIFGAAGIPANAQPPEKAALHILTGTARNDRLILGDAEDATGAILALNPSIAPQLDAMLTQIAEARRKGALSDYGKALQ